MNKVLQQIKDDLKVSMKKEIEFRKRTDMSQDDYDLMISQKIVSRAIISMIPLTGKKPNETTESDIIKLLNRYIKNEKERTLYELHFLKEDDVKDKSSSEVKKIVSDKIQELGDKLTSYLIEIAQGYLPKQASEEDIISYIKENIDLSKFKNKMQAMGPLMKQFSGTDGNFMKSILMKIE